MTRSEYHLRSSVAWLPRPVRRAMLLALNSGWYTIEPNEYESATGVCPFVAAAKMAGVWRNGHAADGGLDWGSEAAPSNPCFIFAVSFDVYAEEAGTDRAIEVVFEGLATERVPVAA